MLRRQRVGPPAEAGFTFLWVLIAIAILSIGLLAASEVWVTSARRQKMVELEWIGAQFTQAIGGYYYATPGVAKAYPKSLQELLEDRRFLSVRRHLRSIYANPFTGKQDWVMVVAADGSIRGVRAIVPGGDNELVKEFLYVPEPVRQGF
jgi:type II secretory pathway pseudopilin PulG